MAKFELLFGEWIIRYRILIILGCLGLVAFAVGHDKPFNPTTNYRVFFSSENPELTAFENLEANFSKNDNILFVITPKDGNAYSKQTLAAVDYLSSEEQTRDGKGWITKGKAWFIPYMSRVDSITNFRHAVAKPNNLTNVDEIKTEPLVIDPEKLTPQDLIKIRKIIESEPTLLKRVVSVKGDIAAVNVTINLPGIDTKTEGPAAVKKARQLAKDVEEKFPGTKVRLVGMIMFNNAFTEASMNDVKTLYPIALGLILAFLILLLRSISATLMTLVIMFMSIATAMGFALRIGFPITPPVMTAPIVILTVAIANSVHILVTFVGELRLGKDRIAAIKESLRINITPVFLTSLTTILGFLTMNFSDVPPFNHLGNIVAIGVVASFIFASAFLPAVLSFIPSKVKQAKATSTAHIDGFADFVIKRRRPIFWTSLLVIVTCISFLPRNVLNDVFLEYFSKRIELRQDMDYTTKNLTGLYQVDYAVDSGVKEGLNNPEFLKETQHFVDWLRKPYLKITPEFVAKSSQFLVRLQTRKSIVDSEFLLKVENFVALVKKQNSDTDPNTTHFNPVFLAKVENFNQQLTQQIKSAKPELKSSLEKYYTVLDKQRSPVKHVFTFLDTLKRLNKTMHNDDPAWYKLPHTRNMTADYINQYEGSVPQGFDPKNQVDIPMRSTRITLNLRTMSTNELIAFEKSVQQHLKQYKTIKSANGSGPTMMFSRIGKRNIISMLLGTTIALVLISFILIIAFRSLKIGLVSMIPNLVPGAMAFGLWGLLNGQIGLALSIVTGMTLGIVVDDTVHFLSKYLRARREHNANPMDSIRYAFHKVGFALVTTSIVLVAGFLIIAMSAFKLNADMGLLTAGVIVLALAADFLFLPTLLMLVEGKNDEKSINNNSHISTGT